jgi:N-acetylglucosamine kinase-like BadF-type ATPase
MTPVVVGLDVGGTKTALAVERLDGERLVTRELPSGDWSASPVADAASWIATRVAGVVPSDQRVVALGVGAQGCDTNTHCLALGEALGAQGFDAVVVNDAALLLPAAGIEQGIGVISGTGAIAVGQDAHGGYLFAGGWGWVLGDEAGAAGIVRDATRAVLLAHDQGLPDDGLLRALLGAFDVPDAPALARAVNDEPTMDNWGARAPAVFAAAEAGSLRADAVVRGAAGHLVELIGQLRRRGALGGHVVAAGSVIVHQPRLMDTFRALLSGMQPDLVAHLLTEPPVRGAVALARRRAATRPR